MINKHTAVFLDLKSRALVMSYMDIVVEESPIIPYSINRRYVYGSTSATVDIFGMFFVSKHTPEDFNLKFNENVFICVGIYSHIVLSTT